MISASLRLISAILRLIFASPRTISPRIRLISANLRVFSPKIRFVDWSARLRSNSANLRVFSPKIRLIFASLRVISPRIRMIYVSLRVISPRLHSISLSRPSFDLSKRTSVLSKLSIVFRSASLPSRPWAMISSSALSLCLVPSRMAASPYQIKAHCVMPTKTELRDAYQVSRIDRLQIHHLSASSPTFFRVLFRHTREH